MPTAIARLRRVLGMVAFVLALAGCATQLAPAYDRVVVEGLLEVNSQVMTILASVSAGTRAETFASREDRYNRLIGRVDALVIQAGARPAPRNRASEALNRALERRGLPPLGDADGDIPSATALKKISETLVKLRDTDRKQGVTAFEVQAFKGQASIYLDQALTYENFLER